MRIVELAALRTIRPVKELSHTFFGNALTHDYRQIKFMTKEVGSIYSNRIFLRHLGTKDVVSHIETLSIFMSAPELETT